MPSIFSDSETVSSNLELVGLSDTGDAEEEENASPEDGGDNGKQDSERREAEKELRISFKNRRSLRDAESALRTSGEAFVFCDDLIAKQVLAASLQKAEPNKAVKGDAAARLSLLLLLNDQQRRRLFLKTASKQENWPRLRSLFGAPPYSFLGPADASVLRAGGFAKTRANMSYENARAANVAQFGPGQFEDQHAREYRVVQQEQQKETPLGIDFLYSTTRLVLQVKVKKTSVKRKRELAMSIFSKQLLFPQPGTQTVHLKVDKTGTFCHKWSPAKPSQPNLTQYK